MWRQNIKINLSNLRHSVNDNICTITYPSFTQMVILFKSMFIIYDHSSLTHNTCIYLVAP